MPEKVLPMSPNMCYLCPQSIHLQRRGEAVCRCDLGRLRGRELWAARSWGYPHSFRKDHYLQILRGIILKGIGMSYLWTQFLVLTAIGIILISASILRFRKKL